MAYENKTGNNEKDGEEDDMRRKSRREVLQNDEPTDDLEGMVNDAKRRQEAREEEACDPDAAYQSIAAQTFLRSQGGSFTSLLGINNKEEDTRIKLSRIFQAIWEEENPDPYLSRMQRFLFGLARQIGIPGPYERAVEAVREDSTSSLEALESFITAVKEDNKRLTATHGETVEEVKRLKQERATYLERMGKAMADAQRRKAIYDHLSGENGILNDDMDLARRAGDINLLEAQGIESLKLERDIDETHAALTKIKHEMEECNLKIPYYDSRIASLYQGLDNVDADLITHSEYVILLETARDILKESLKYRPEEDVGQIAARHERSGRLIETIYQNLPSFDVRPRILTPGKVKKPRGLGPGRVVRNVHERVHNLIDDIATITAAHQSYREKGGRQHGPGAYR